MAQKFKTQVHKNRQVPIISHRIGKIYKFFFLI